MLSFGRNAIIIPVIVIGLILAALLVPTLVSVPVAAQEGGQQASNATQNALWALGEPLGLFGPFNYSDGNAVGRFVQFTFLQNESTMLNYSVSNGTDNVTIFSQLSFAGLEANPDISITGPLFEIAGNTSAVLVHNNPTGLMQVISLEQGEGVNLTLGDGMKVAEENLTNTSVLNITGNGINGTLLIYNGSVSQAAGNATNLIISFGQEGAMQFRIAPRIGSAGDVNEMAIQEAFSRADLAGEAWVTVNGSNYIYEDASINGVTPHVDTARIGEVRMQLNYTPVDNKGKLVLVNIDNQVINPSGNVSIVFNNETIANASNLAAVIDAVNSSSGNASYYALGAGNITKYLIFIPTFQENNTLVISTMSSQSSGLGFFLSKTLPLGLLLVVLTLSAARFIDAFRPRSMERRQ